MKRKAEDQGDDVFMTEEDARGYNDHVRKSSDRRFDQFLKTCRKLEIKGRYLDVGSGPGFVTELVARQHPDAQITGIDISPEMVKMASETIPDEFRNRINYVMGDACDKNTISGLGTFDLIFSTFTMHHWADATKAIRNLYDLLNENGVIYIYDLKRVWWMYYIRSKSGFIKSIRASYTKKELEQMLKEIGIKDFTIRTVPPFFLMNVIIHRNA
jgi:ubiquinone/menaquinone biosynthesis C-methylase UbiE